MTHSATSGSDGFETRTMVSVAASSRSKSSACRVVMPPTGAHRSRLPVPMAWLMPSPARSSKHATSCRPVPEAPISPIRPRRTTLANPKPMPSRMAVPQSGPITSKPRSRARCFRSTSSSSDTLSEKRNTCRPSASAWRASPAANGPGTEMTARRASGSARCAARSDRGGLVVASASAGALRRPDSSRSACCSAEAASASLAARTAMTRSFGPAESASPASNPESRST